MKSENVILGVGLAIFLANCANGAFNPSLETRVERLVREQHPQYYSIEVFSILENTDKTAYQVSFKGISPYNDIEVRETEIFSKSELEE